MRRFFFSLRFRLILLVLLAIIPALGVTFYSGLEQRQIAATQAKEEAMRLARFASSNQSQLIEEARHFLYMLAQLSQVRTCDPKACSSLFANLLKQYPWYLNIGIASPDGNIFASAVPITQPVNIADRSYFRLALKTRKFAIGDYQIGRIVGKPVVNFGYPVLNEAREVKAVVYVALSLGWLNQLSAAANLPSRSTLTVINHNGMTLAHHPDSEKWVGKTIREVPIVKTILSEGEGMVETIGTDGVKRLYAFTSFGGMGQAGNIYISIGIPTQTAFAKVDRILNRNLALLAFIGLIALVVTWIGGDLLVLRRLNPLLSGIKRLGAGHLSARSGIAYGKGELSQLAFAFDQMAESLEQREAEHKRAEKALKESEKKYRQVVENATEIIYTVDASGNFTYGNPAGLKVTGYSLQELRELNYADLVLHDHRERVMKTYINQFRQRIPTTHVEFPFFNKAGKIIWFGQNSSLVVEGDKITGFHIIARDITERKKAEQALSESEQRYRNLVENAPDVIYTLASDGTITSLNPAFERITGWSRSEWLNRPFHTILHPADLSQGLELFERILKGEKIAPFELRVLGKSGDYLVAEFTVTPQTQNGSVIGLLGMARDVTERQRAEDALRAEKERFRLAAESSTDLIYEWDIKERVDWFGKIDELLGYAPSEFPRTFEAWANSVHPEDRDRVEAAVKNHLEKNEPYDIEYRVTRKDGTYNYWWARGTAVRDEKGNPSRWVGAVTDITERKVAEETLKKSEQRYRTLVESSTDAILMLDSKRNISTFNQAFLDMFGYEKGEIEGRSIRIIHSSDESFGSFSNKAYASIGRLGFFRGEWELRHKNGTIFPVETVTSAIRAPDGLILGYIATIRDITERKQAEDSLRESVQVLRAFLNANPEVSFLIDAKGTVLVANESLFRRFSKSSEEIIGSCLYDLFPKDVAKQRKSHFDEVFRTGKPIHFEDVRMDRNYETFAHPVFDKEGKIAEVAILGFDITERKKAEEALRISEEKYRTILENIEDGYYEVDLNGNFTFFNDSMCRIYGYSREEMMGMNDRQYTNQENAKKLFQAFNRVFRTGESTKEFNWEIIRKDGTKRNIEASASSMKDSSGNRIGFRGLVHDITDRKRAEQEMMALQEQLRQSQKMEAIGRLAGGIAHDFNNLLTIIKGYTQLSVDEIKKDDPLRENIEEIRKAADRAAGLTRQLLAFSRRQIMEMKVLDLNTTLQDLDKMLRRLIGEDIELVTLLEKDLGRVRTDPGQMEQVIVNLAVNARDAMTDGGKLTIETANVELDQAYARAHIAVTPGRYVMISVSDTGVGMTPEVRDRIFEPFFTTKAKGKGTGLGLSTVYGIVKQSGGNIWVYSEPGKGTTFKIYLPCVAESSEKLKERPATQELSRGSETILIVEDEKVVLKLAGRILRKQGYEVWEMLGGEAAVKMCEEQKKPFHLLLTDVVMPQMSGRQLAERLKKICKDFKVIYMSGYTDNAITHHGVLDKGVNYLQKPFTVGGLVKKVREVLDE